MTLTVTAIGLDILDRVSLCFEDCGINPVNLVNRVNLGNLKGERYSVEVDEPGSESNRTRLGLTTALTNIGLTVLYSSDDPRQIYVFNRVVFKIRV